MHGIIKITLYVLVVSCTCNIYITANCPLLVDCLADRGAVWSGEMPDIRNIDVGVWTGFYNFLCSNRDEYLLCEIENRTTVRYCSDLSGASLMEGTYEELSEILDKSCSVIEGLVQSEVCFLNPNVSSDVGACFGTFRTSWASASDDSMDSYRRAYCELIHQWTSCRLQYVIDICPSSATTAMNTWDKAQSEAFCGNGSTDPHATLILILGFGLLMTLYCFL